MTSEDVINRLAELFVMNGVPECIRSDNGPEFIAKAIQQWLTSLDVKTLYVEPGSPWQNGYAESFHSRLRDELLNMEEFDSVRHARAHAKAWREDYNGYRPHSSLGGYPLMSSRDAVLITFQLRLHFISTAKPNLLPNPYSHNTWIKNGGIPVTPI